MVGNFTLDLRKNALPRRGREKNPCPFLLYVRLKSALKQFVQPGASGHEIVLGDCYSAGRVYDKISDTAEAVIAYVTPKGCVCELVLDVNEMEHSECSRE